MKPFKKSHLIFMITLILIVSLTGCNSKKTDDTTTDTTETTGVPADDFGTPVDYDTVYIEELPIDIQLQIDALIVQRGYYKWTTDDGANYLLISSGEKPTGGYGIEMVSFGDYDGDYKVLVGEGKPAKDAVVPQIITYPYVVIKYVGDLEITEVYNENSEAYALLEPSTVETLSVTGIYQGQIDNNSIEVKVGENFMAFRSVDFETLLAGIETGDTVEIKYVTNNEGQNDLIELTKK